ncbi:MAG TPA: hypothetical protein VGL01_17580 [Trinickia sp.]
MDSNLKEFGAHDFATISMSSAIQRYLACGRKDLLALVEHYKIRTTLNEAVSRLPETFQFERIFVTISNGFV